MPQDITDVDEFTFPIVAPAGADGADLTYILTLTQGLANRARWLFNRMGGVAYPVTRSVIVNPVQAAASGGALGWQAGVASPGTSPAYPQSIANSAWLPIDLADYLPNGCTLEQIKALIDPGAARTGDDRVQMMLMKSTPNFVTPGNTYTQIGSTHSDDTTTNIQVLSTGVGSLGEVINKALYSYQLLIKAGNNASTNPDTLYGLKIVFSDPGVTP